MSNSPYVDSYFLIPAVLCWTVLFILYLVDGIRHRTVRSRGWQLFACVVIVMGINFCMYWTLLMYKFAHTHQLGITSFLFYLSTFFMVLSDSTFIGLIVAIAAGYCITRDSLGPYTARVVLIPTVYFVTDLVFAYTDYAVTGTAGFELSDAEHSLEDLYTGWQMFILSICLVGNLVALLLSWVYTFDMLSQEIEMLELQANRHKPPVDVERGRSEASWAAGGIHQGTDIQSEEPGEPTSFADHLALRSKATLMRRFCWAVIVYVVATAAVELLPLIVIQAVEFVVVVGHAAVTAIFLAALGFIFKLREDSPYLNVMADDDDMIAMTGGMSTALGVLESRSPSPSPRHTNGTTGIFSATRRPEDDTVESAPNGVTMDPHFSIADEEDYENLGVQPKYDTDLEKERDRPVDRKAKKDIDGKND